MEIAIVVGIILLFAILRAISKGGASSGTDIHIDTFNQYNNYNFYFGNHEDGDSNVPDYVPEDWSEKGRIE